MSWYNEATVPADPTRVGQDGLDLIKRFEGYSDEAYPDPATGGEPWTIGYGTTRANGRPVRPGMTTTHHQAESWLQADLRAFERTLRDVIRVRLEQHEFDALGSLVYNIGGDNLRSSTLVKKLNQGNRKAAAKEFPKWCMANGKVMTGLERRRAAEQRLFRGIK